MTGRDGLGSTQRPPKVGVIPGISSPTSCGTGTGARAGNVAGTERSSGTRRSRSQNRDRTRAGAGTGARAGIMAATEQGRGRNRQGDADRVGGNAGQAWWTEPPRSDIQHHTRRRIARARRENELAGSVQLSRFARLRRICARRESSMGQLRQKCSLSESCPEPNRPGVPLCSGTRRSGKAGCHRRCGRHTLR